MKFLPPRTGVFRIGMKRLCVDTPHEKSPLLLGEMRALRDRGAVGLFRLRQSIEGGVWPVVGNCLGRGNGLIDAWRTPRRSELLRRWPLPRLGFVARLLRF